MPPHHLNPVRRASPMHIQVEIREIQIADNYEMMSGMMHELHKNEYTLFDKTASWHDIEGNYMKHVINLQQQNEGMCLVAFKGNEAIGFIFGYLEEQDDSRIEVYTGKELYISDGYVVPQYRRQGIYHQLNAWMEDYYINLGIRRILRYTLLRNAGMRQFLENQDYFVTRLLYEKWL